MKTEIIRRIIKLLDEIKDETFEDLADEIISYHKTNDDLLDFEKILIDYIKKIKDLKNKENENEQIKITIPFMRISINRAYAGYKIRHKSNEYKEFSKKIEMFFIKN